MSKSLQLAIATTLLSIAAHVYLTLHYYPLKFGAETGSTLCNINAVFNCDAVAASRYSAFLDIPLSVWGVITNVLILLILIVNWLGWTESPMRWQIWARFFTTLSLIASAVMAVIGFTQMRNYCVVCMILYILSIVAFIATKQYITTPLKELWRNWLSQWSREIVALGIILLSVPGLAFFTHKSFVQSYGAQDLDVVIRSSINEWLTNPQVDLQTAPALQFGAPAEKAVLTISEFADYRCPHCKHAAPTLHAFAQSHADDVRLLFYNFPLDSQCNEAISRGDGLSCHLAKSVLCAERQNKGWDLHALIFERQDQLSTQSSTSSLNEFLKPMSEHLNLDWNQLSSCQNDAALTDVLRNQAKQGVLAKVMGTPTIFANSRLLPRGQLIPVLEAARQQALNKSN